VGHGHAGNLGGRRSDQSVDAVTGVGKRGYGKDHGNRSSHADRGFRNDKSALSPSALGRLNAAHAAARARERAAPHSAVGRIAAYQTAITDRPRDIETAAENLAKAANKPIDRAVVRAVNNLLGIQVSRRAVNAVARKAEAIRTDKPTDRDHDHESDRDHDHESDRDHDHASDRDHDHASDRDGIAEDGREGEGAAASARADAGAL
jgi:hypothetical protein